MRTPFEQAIHLLEQSHHPLIVTRAQYSGDGLAAVCALGLVCHALGKQADLACANFSLPHRYSFLPLADTIRGTLPSLRRVNIRIPTDKLNINDCHYEVRQDVLEISLSPTSGQFNLTDLRATVSDWHYDLIIAVDAPDWESLGALYSEHRELYYARPSITIDASAANEEFGTVNLVDLTAGSVCAALSTILQRHYPTQLTPDVTTCLLAGIIDRTRGFRSSTIHPETLQLASTLMEHGARREEIIHFLYYNRSVGTLKLWGRTLQTLTSHANGRVVSATVSAADFAATTTSADNLPDLVDELLAASPQVELIVLAAETAPQTVTVLVKSLGPLDVLQTLGRYQPQGDRHTVRFSLSPAETTTVTQTIVDTLTAARRSIG